MQEIGFEPQMWAPTLQCLLESLEAVMGPEIWKPEVRIDTFLCKLNALIARAGGKCVAFDVLRGAAHSDSCLARFAFSIVRLSLSPPLVCADAQSGSSRWL